MAVRNGGASAAVNGLNGSESHFLRYSYHYGKLTSGGQGVYLWLAAVQA
jgi:hypothetical protein